MVVRCTKKMLDLLGGRTLTLSDLPPSDQDWYLNLIWIEPQKCLLLTHSGTLFSVFRSDVHAADLRPLGACLVGAIQTELRAEGLPETPSLTSIPTTCYSRRPRAAAPSAS